MSGSDAGDAGDDMDATLDSGMDPEDAGDDASDDAADDAGDDAADDAGDPATASEQLAAVHAAADGTGLDLPVANVYVTYTKPATGNEDAGFFVQAEASGPAIFVALDPSAQTPSLDVGDRIAFTVTELGTTGGLRQVTALTGLSRASTGNSIESLITEVSSASDLLSALDSYESRAIRITGTLGTFAIAGIGFSAAPIATVAANDVNLRLRMPTDVRDEYDLTEACSVTVDHGVMWRFNTIAQPSVYSAADLDELDCPAPTVVSAAAIDATHVRVIFDRKIVAATATAARFTLDQGAVASAVSVDGDTVTVTTSSALVQGTTYTVTVAPQVTDLLGAGVATPNTAMFELLQLATLALNEINPNIASQHDLIELLALTSGSIEGITVVQRGPVVDTLVTFPDLTVASGDLLIVHLNAGSAAGAAAASESTAKNQYPAATFSANYDNAWDILGGATGLTFSNRILEVRSPGAVLQDVVPVVLSNNPNPPAVFPTSLQAIQTAGAWLPIDCAGMPCTYVTTPSAIDVSVDYLGCGTAATGNSIARDVGGYAGIKADWNAAAANSWGLPNP